MNGKTVTVKVRPHLHANANEASRGEAYANICLDCYTRQNVVICRASEWFSLKYRLQADSVRSASDQTEAVFLSSVTRLHCYACLARIFVLMWMHINSVTSVCTSVTSDVGILPSHQWNITHWGYQWQLLVWMDGHKRVAIFMEQYNVTDRCYALQLCYTLIFCTL